MAHVYDTIGGGYAVRRRPDPRIAAAIEAALGNARSVVNVGAGAGSYEPAERAVVAVEPSAVMIAQRPPGAAPVVRATAERLPFGDGAFDAAMAVLTIHHWDDPAGGIAEMRRVARRVVVLVWDQPVTERFWLVREYLPQIAELDRPRAVSMRRLSELLGGADIRPLPVPHDCVDGFLGAYWRRPEAYLEADVQAAISSLATLGERAAPGLARLAADLDSGAWRRRHADLLELDELDVGYRLVTTA
ncbi:MAG: class I SAM-dependent methyltransferase [Gaiellales bacterium]